MTRLVAVLAPVLCAAAVAVGAGAGAAVRQCPADSIGPGSLRHGSPAGAECLLAAFRDGCRAADYVLSSFGVDTIDSEEFRTARRAAGCVVSVTQSFRVVPRPPHATGRRSCARVRRAGSDIVADRCTGSGPATISLTMLR